MLLYLSFISFLSAQPTPDRVDYLRNIIKKVKDTPATQQSPAPEEKRTEEERPDPIQTDPPKAVSTSTTIPAAVGTTKNNLYTVRHGQLPNDREYWQFMRYYRSHSVVSLIVNGDNKSELISSLTSLNSLYKKGVQIGEVLITSGRYLSTFINDGDSHEEKSLLPKDREIGSVAAGVGLDVGMVSDVSNLLTRMNIQYSPTWIVRHKNKDYVYEGVDSVEKYFSYNGIFRDVDR